MSKIYQYKCKPKTVVVFKIKLYISRFGALMIQKAQDRKAQLEKDKTKNGP